MDRMACVDLPALPLQLLLRRHPGWREHPTAVVDRDKAQGTLLWVNGAARKHHILPGMRYAAGLSLSRELRAGTVEPEEITTALDELTEALRFFTAGVESSRAEPGVFWLDAAGLSLLHPSLKRWAKLLHADLQGREFYATVAVGFTRFGTYALARAGRGVKVMADPAEEQHHAHRIAIERLGFDPDTRDALHKLGLRTLGDFLALPSPGVLKRFGPEVHRLYKLATGELWAPLQPAPPQDPVRTSRRLDDAETDLERLLFLVEQQLRELLRELVDRRLLLRSVVLHLDFEDADARSESLQPAQPTIETKQVLELLRLRLEGAPLAAGVCEIGLELIGIEPSRDQIELFPSNPRRDLTAAQRALARLRAEFGERAVLRATLTDGHLPEARFLWEKLDVLEEAEPRTVQRRPLVRRILARPLALSRQRRQEPDGWMILGLEGGAVEEVVGPYVVSGGWWRREVHREYHFVRTAKAGWLWVYFDRQRRRWFLQGAVE
jgi:protein ImuB